MMTSVTLTPTFLKFGVMVNLTFSTRIGEIFALAYLMRLEGLMIWRAGTGRTLVDGSGVLHV